MECKCNCEELFGRYFPFVGKLTKKEADLLCSSIKRRFYSKNENVHGGSGECTGGILVKSGCLRAYLLSEDGKEITLYRLYKGDICMLSASCVLESITFDVFVDAAADSECYIINSKVFGELSETNIHVKNFALEVAVSRFSDVIWVMQQILFMSFDRRLAIFLYEEMNTTKSLNIQLTHEEIAKYMGSAREVVSRMLKYFVSEGIVDKTRGGITIKDKEKLKALAL